MGKGAATTMSSIILIILLVGMIATYIATVNDEIKKEMEISLKKAEILRAKNTFYLLNRSLETTWFISTVQVIFKTGEDFTESFCQGNLEENLEKYMKDKMEDYIRIPGYDTPIKVNDVDITISRIEPDIQVNDNEIISDVSETITANYVETDIVSDTSHESNITTYFKKLAEYGCEAAIDLVSGMMSSMPEYTQSTTKSEYLTIAENYIRSVFNSINVENGIEKDLTKDELRLVVSPGLSGLTLNYGFAVVFSDAYEYYYHDEGANRFVKKPFSINVKMADSVEVLTCGDGLYNWDWSDMLCCDGSIYTCGIGDSELPGIDGNNLGSGQERCGYACTGTYFCTEDEAQSDINCCENGWDGGWDIVDCNEYECLENECLEDDGNGNCTKWGDCIRWGDCIDPVYGCVLD
jgi:hypothetical protein